MFNFPNIRVIITKIMNFAVPVVQKSKVKKYFSKILKLKKGKFHFVTTKALYEKLFNNRYGFYSVFGDCNLPDPVNDQCIT